MAITCLILRVVIDFRRRDTPHRQFVDYVPDADPDFTQKTPILILKQFCD